VLAAGGFPGAANYKLQQHWAPRFTREIPESLRLKIFPMIPFLEERLVELEKQDGKVPSVRSMIAVLSTWQPVGLQDALNLVYTKACMNASGEIANPFIKMLMQEPEFQKELRFALLCTSQG
jgi:hypothetical protein